MRLASLAAELPIEVLRDADFRSLGLLSLSGPAMLACLYDARAARHLRTNPDLACVITAPALAADVPDHLGVAVGDPPRDAFHDIQRHLGSATDFYGADAPSDIAPDARIDADASIASRNVRIGPGCLVECGARILEGSALDAGVVVRAGAVIGAEGFHPVPYRGGLTNMPHHGGAHLGRGVEVQANAGVCRATFSAPTRIGAETVLGPLTYVAHGVTVGERCRIGASARLAGSCVVGDKVVIGPNAVVSNQVTVGHDARISIGSVVVHDVPAGRTATGNFAVEHSLFLGAWSRFFR